MQALAVYPDTASTRRKRGEVIILLVLLSLMSYFQRTSMSIAGPAIARQFALSETQMGEIYSAFILGYALCMIPGGWLADRWGPRLTIGAVALLTSVFTGLAGIFGLLRLAPVLLTFIAIRFLLGCSTAPLYPASARMNANWMPIERRGWVQGWIAAGAGLGGALSPFLFNWAIARVGWPAAFWLTGAATIGIALIWMSRTSDRPAAQATRVAVPVERVNWKVLFTNRNLMLLAASYVATGYFEYIFFYWVFYYLGEIRHVGSSQSAIYTTALFAAWAVMAPLGGKISDNLVRRWGQNAGRRLVPIIGLLASAVCVAVGINLASASATGVMLALALGLAAATDGPFWASAIQLGGRQAGSAGGLMNTGGNAGGFLAPLVTPWLASRFGWSAGLYFGCAVVAVAAFLWCFVVIPNEAQENGSSR